jgi:Flp pilus assembly protein TadG
MAGSKLLVDTRGGALIEGALLMPVLLLATLGAVYFGLEYWYALSLSQATYTAARCRAIDSTKCGSDTAAKSFAASRSWGLSTDNLTFQTASCSNGVSLSGTAQTQIKLLGYLNLSIPLQAQICNYLPP